MFKFKSSVIATLAFLSVGISSCATQQSQVRLTDGSRIVTLRRDYTNSHLVEKDGNAYLVDAGFESHGPDLAEDLKKAGFPPEKLKAIILTHAHADHAGGAAYLKKTFGIPVVAGRADSKMLSSGGVPNLMCPTSWMARFRLESDRAVRYAHFKADYSVDKELDLQPITGIPGKVVLMPGHTEGSLVVVLSDAVLVGDLFRGSIFRNSAEIHFYICDLEANRRDILRLLNEIAPSVTQFFPGHFGPLHKSDVLGRFSME